MNGVDVRGGDFSLLSMNLQGVQFILLQNVHHFRLFYAA